MERGDLEALATRFCSDFHRLALHFTKGDPSSADDLIQETFLKIMARAEHIAPEGHVDEYIRSTMYHAAVSARRRDSAYERHVSSCTYSDEVPDLALALMSDRDSRSALCREIGGLCDTQRDSLVLHHFGGLSYDEIGKILGIDPKVVKYRIAHGIEKLREVLARADRAA